MPVARRLSRAKSGHLGRRSDARARGLALISIEKSNNGFSLSDAGQTQDQSGFVNHH